MRPEEGTKHSMCTQLALRLAQATLGSREWVLADRKPVLGPGSGGTEPALWDLGQLTQPLWALFLCCESNPEDPSDSWVCIPLKPVFCAGFLNLPEAQSPYLSQRGGHSASTPALLPGACEDTGDDKFGAG